MPSPANTPEWTFVPTILDALSPILTNFSNASASDAEHIRHLQELAQLPVTGLLDRPTWSILVRLYHALVVRGALSSLS